MSEKSITETGQNMLSRSMFIFARIGDDTWKTAQHCEKGNDNNRTTKEKTHFKFYTEIDV
jgi:hypothetical protein